MSDTETTHDLVPPGDILEQAAIAVSDVAHDNQTLVKQFQGYF